MRGKLGRAAPTDSPYSRATAPVIGSHIAPLGTPPSTSVDRFSAVGTDWKMMANDRLGCCVAADTGHAILFLSTLAGKPIIPTDDDIEKLYSYFGYDPARPIETDIGISEQVMCAWLTGHDFLGFKADDYATLDHTNLDALRWATELFCSCRIGINMPISAGQQFDQGLPFSLLDDDGGIEGRHDMRIVNYRSAADGTWFDVVTWGRVVPAHETWVAKYIEEAYVELFYDIIQKNGASPGGFNLDALASDLNSLRR